MMAREENSQRQCAGGNCRVGPEGEGHVCEVACMTELERKCVDAGLKMTGQRRAILEVLANADDHPSVETVYQRSKDLDSSISIATVYRTLNILDQMNLVKKHDFNDNHARFEANLAVHYHFVDVESGEVIEFQDEELDKRLRQIAEKLGAKLVDRRVELYGRKS